MQGVIPEEKGWGCSHLIHRRLLSHALGARAQRPPDCPETLPPMLITFTTGGGFLKLSW